MQKISSSTATANGAGEFTQGQPGSGVDATMITVAWLNAIQRELVNLVVGSGQALTEADDGQVLKAVKMLQELASAWDKITGKPTTRDGYKLSDVFTKTETGTAIQTAIAALVASSPAALDTLKELADALGNDPNFAASVTNALAAKMPSAGGAFYPKLSGLSFNSEVGGYDKLGCYLGWGANGSGSAQFICNPGGGNTGGFLWATANAAGVVSQAMTYTPAGILNIPTALFVPAITSNTTVSTQSPGYAGGYIANCAFVSTAVSSKLTTNSALAAGFASSDKAQPFMQYVDGTVVKLQVDRPKDTALLAPNGWSKNADTGEIIQWMEYNLGDMASTTLVNVAWPFRFPNQFLNARVSFKLQANAQCAVQGSFSLCTVDGCTIRVEEWAGVVQTGLVLMVEARGN